MAHNISNLTHSLGIPFFLQCPCTRKWTNVHAFSPINLSIINLNSQGLWPQNLRGQRKSCSSTYVLSSQILEARREIRNRKIKKQGPEDFISFCLSIVPGPTKSVLHPHLTSLRWLEALCIWPPAFSRGSQKPEPVIYKETVLNEARGAEKLHLNCSHREQEASSGRRDGNHCFDHQY